MKVCSKCKIEKNLVSFNKDKYSSDGFSSQCKKCRNDNRKKWVSKNKRNKNKKIPKILECSKCKKVKNSDCFFVDNEKTNGLTSHCKECHKNYQFENREKIAKRVSKWNQKNIVKNRFVRAKYARKKRKNDEIFRIRELVSRSVGNFLNKQNGCKNSSTWSKLQYTPQQLKEHLEKQFEPWMNWENYGKASNDKKTWQIDHIYPQSKLPYDSLEHPNFQRCWSLENLRPLEAKENLRKGDKILIIEKNNS